MPKPKEPLSEKMVRKGAAGPRSTTAPPGPPPPALEAAKNVQYRFWNKSRCPHCQSIETEAYATVGPVQYRRCRAPVCRRKFTVAGEAV